MKVRISRVLLQSLLREAATADPVECCGLLVGDADEIVGAVPSPNRAGDPCTAFELDTGVHLSAQRKAREQGLAIVGHYHSHPSGSPEPSKIDAARADKNARLWLVIAGEAARLWIERQDGELHGRFDPVDLELRDAPPCKAWSEPPIGSARE